VITTPQKAPWTHSTRKQRDTLAVTGPEDGLFYFLVDAAALNAYIIIIEVAESNMARSRTFSRPTFGQAPCVPAGSWS
jgi:hypothetical protein